MMEKKYSTIERIFKNIFWLLMQMGVKRLTAFFLTVILARYLGPVNYGNLSFAIAFVEFFTIFGNLGIEVYTVKEVSSNKDLTKYFFSKGLLLSIAFGIIVGILIFLASQFIHSDKTLLYILYLIGLSYIFSQIASFLNSLFRAHENMLQIFFIELAHKIPLLIFCLLCVFLKASIIYIAWSYLSASVFYLVYSLLVSFKFFEIRISKEIRHYIDMILKSFPYGLSNMVLIAYFSADIIILFFLKGNESVGIYNSAYKLFLALGTITSIYFGATFPTFSRLSKESYEGLKKGYEKTFKFLVILAIPLAVGGMILSKEIVTLIYGKPFLLTSLPFSLLLSVIPITFLNAFFGHFLLAIGKVKKNLTYFSATCFTNIFLNLLLIPVFDYIGSAFSTIVSEIIFFILAFNYLKHKGYGGISTKTLLKVLANSILMGSILFLLRGQNIFFLILIGALAYLISVLVSKTINLEDLKLLKEGLGIK